MSTIKCCFSFLDVEYLFTQHVHSKCVVLGWSPICEDFKQSKIVFYLMLLVHRQALCSKSDDCPGENNVCVDEHDWKYFEASDGQDTSKGECILVSEGDLELVSTNVFISLTLHQCSTTLQALFDRNVVQLC